MNTTPFPRLLGDIGGTNARFAWLSRPGAALSDVRSYRCAEHPTLEAAIRQYLHEQGGENPAACALGIANPVDGDQVRMTNHHWAFSIRELRQGLGLQRLEVLNDFTALALALPALPAQELQQLGGRSLSEAERTRPHAPLALLGAGTGLGVSGLLPAAGGQFLPLAGEGGHATLPACDDEEDAVLRLLRQEFGHVSAERALSGPGLSNLAWAAARLRGAVAERLEPAAVINGARAGDADCQHAVGWFCAFLGSVAGNLALTLGAQGGVYIGGGIAPRLLPELRASRFRERFEGKGRFAPFLTPIPCWVIDSPVSPALLGAARALEQM
ncbi:glucokinase [Inhella proteolytica]|uniref:Glucokinase n=1 Tax=Inhella proteolytica TaxID=2795029 RepID=A0A931J4M6_9BURK|nr:glucokinase [Inhella proteolytica]MBH9576232.1 glucokinase [Inhella proteolytica]